MILTGKCCPVSSCMVGPASRLVLRLCSCSRNRNGFQSTVSDAFHDPRVTPPNTFGTGSLFQPFPRASEPHKPLAPIEFLWQISIPTLTGTRYLRNHSRFSGSFCFSATQSPLAPVNPPSHILPLTVSLVFVRTHICQENQLGSGSCQTKIQSVAHNGRWSSNGALCTARGALFTALQNHQSRAGRHLAAAWACEQQVPPEHTRVQIELLDLLWTCPPIHRLVLVQARQLLLLVGENALLDHVVDGSSHEVAQGEVLSEPAYRILGLDQIYVVDWHFGSGVSGV